MSEPVNDILGPARASMRARLGEFADVYMDAKIEIAKKLAAMIVLESNPAKLMRLKAKLNDVMLAEDDINQLDSKLKAFLGMCSTNAGAFLALRDHWKTSLTKRHEPR